MQDKDVHLRGLVHRNVLANQLVRGVDMRMRHQLEILAQLRNTQARMNSEGLQCWLVQ